MLALVGKQRFVDGGNVTIDGFPQVMNDAHFEHFQHVEIGQLIFKNNGHQAKAPAVFRCAFGASARGVCASEHVLEFFRLAQEFEAPFDFLDVHNPPG
ncbi:hypothetical protein D3C80_1889960 [compost metagenome]